MQRKYFRLLLIVSVFAMVLPVSAATWWNPLSWLEKPDRQINYLIVTGNYVESRLLAELIHHATEQPVLLLPPGEGEDIYILGPKGKVAKHKATSFADLVKQMNPRTVMFLGNDSFTPKQYSESLKKHLATWSVDNDDWEQIARSAGDILKLKDLAVDYMVYMQRIKNQPIKTSSDSTDADTGDGDVGEAKDDEAAGVEGDAIAEDE